MKVRNLVLAMIVVLGLGGWLVMKFGPRNKVYQAKLASSLLLVSKAPGYNKDPAYHQELVKSAHKSAFEAVFDWRGQRRQGGLWRSYTRILLKRMIKQAEEDGRSAVAQDLTAMLRKMYFPTR